MIVNTAIFTNKIPTLETDLSIRKEEDISKDSFETDLRRRKFVPKSSHLILQDPECYSQVLQSLKS